MIPYKDTLGHGEIVFTHQDEDGTQLMFAVTRLQALLQTAGSPVVLAPVDEQFARWLPSHRGIEFSRLCALAGISSLDPVIFCAMEDAENSYLLVDGSHRYLAAALNQSTYIRAYVVVKAVWEQFLVEAPQVDMEQLLKRPSGISS